MLSGVAAADALEVADVKRTDEVEVVVESPVADIQGYRRLAICYGRPAKHFCGFLTLAAVHTCYKKLTK